MNNSDCVASSWLPNFFYLTVGSSLSLVTYGYQLPSLCDLVTTSWFKKRNALICRMAATDRDLLMRQF